MSGAELDNTEFAYLLAVVNAAGVVGLDAPDLFPQKPAAQDRTYSQGRQNLESNGWLKPAADHDDEFVLDALLLEMISIIANPAFVVASVAGEDAKTRQMVLHYLLEDNIIELSVPEKGSYLIGVVPDTDALQDRIAELLDIADGGTTAGKAKPARTTLDGEQFEDLKAFAQKGKSDRAEAVLESTKLSKGNKTSLLSAMSNPERGQIVVIRPGEEGIEAGRRLTVFAENGSAWLARRLKADAGEVEISAGTAPQIGTLLSELTEELSA
jgi:hypothetical protein